jgi:hypothetical protein
MQTKVHCSRVYVYILLLALFCVPDDDPVPQPNCTVNEVRISPCSEALENLPCKIKRGRSASIHFDFTPSKCPVRGHLPLLLKSRCESTFIRSHVRCCSPELLRQIVHSVNMAIAIGHCLAYSKLFNFILKAVILFLFCLESYCLNLA